MHQSGSSSATTQTPTVGDSAATRPQLRRPWLLLWAASGPLALLLWALYRLAPRAGDALAAVATVQHGLLLGACAVGMIWLEGHRGFHLRVVPDVAARVQALASHATGWRLLLAPLVASELIGAPPRRMIRRWLLVGGVAGAIVATRLLEEPARGIVSMAVFCGLSWGTGSLVLALKVALRAPVRMGNPSAENGAYGANKISAPPAA